MNFIVESFSAEKELSVLPLIILVGGLYAVNYFNIISFSNIGGYGFNAIYKNPLLMLAVCCTQALKSQPHSQAHFILLVPQKIKRACLFPTLTQTE